MGESPRSARHQSGGLKGTTGVEPGAPGGWHSRGILPHFDSEDVIQHVSFHLVDSLPAELLERIGKEVDSAPPGNRDAERRRRIEACVDSGHGCCMLKSPDAAGLVQEALLYFAGKRYHLFAWVIMPNHVHVLFKSIAGWQISRIVASWKSYTGRRLSRMLALAEGTKSPRRVWQREYWDRYIRDEWHLLATIEYIHHNPVKAGLVKLPEDWAWSSANRSLDHKERIATPPLPGAPGSSLA